MMTVNIKFDLKCALMHACAEQQKSLEELLEDCILMKEKIIKLFHKNVNSFASI